MDDKTARKYRQGRKLPSMLKQLRTYRTRKDPFADVWPQVETLLENEPALQAKTLFDWVKKQYPGGSIIVIAGRWNGAYNIGGPPAVRRRT
jgi:hypothetical protein